MPGPFVNLDKSSMVVRDENQLPRHLKSFFDLIEGDDEVHYTYRKNEEWLVLKTKSGNAGLFSAENLSGFEQDRKCLPCAINAPLFVFSGGWVVVIAPGGEKDAKAV